MLLNNYKICNERTISVLCKIRANRFHPHICKNCGARSHIHPWYSLYFMLFISIMFWLVFGVLFLLKISVVFTGLFFPLIVFHAFKLVYPESRNRIYLYPAAKVARASK